MTPRITHRPLKRTSRQNADGLWRCTGTYGCGQYLPRSAFWERADGGPTPWCKACDLARQRRRYAVKGMDDTWWAQELARMRPYRQRISKARKRLDRERGEMALRLLESVQGKGLTPRNIYRLTGINEPTMKRIRARGTLRHGHVLERLTLLHRACWSFPAMTRHAGSPAHPHLAEIGAYYEALREACG